MSCELIKAIWKRDGQTVQKLLEEGFDVNMPDESGWLPLSVATAEKSVSIMKQLIEAGADVNKMGKHDDRTPLHEAISNEQALQLLIEAGADVNARDKDGNSVLYHAMMGDNPSVIKLLINAGAVDDPEKLFKDSPWVDREVLETIAEELFKILMRKQDLTLCQGRKKRKM